MFFPFLVQKDSLYVNDKWLEISHVDHLDAVRHFLAIVINFNSNSMNILDPLGNSSPFQSDYYLRVCITSFATCLFTNIMKLLGRSDRNIFPLTRSITRRQPGSHDCGPLLLLYAEMCRSNHDDLQHIDATNDFIRDLRIHQVRNLE